jgi:hypothetical protein
LFYNYEKNNGRDEHNNEQEILVVLIPISRCCTHPSPMTHIGASGVGVGLTYNREHIGGVTLSSIFKSTVKTAEVASVGDTIRSC